MGFSSHIHRSCGESAGVFEKPAVNEVPQIRAWAEPCLAPGMVLHGWGLESCTSVLPPHLIHSLLHALVHPSIPYSFTRHLCEAWGQVLGVGPKEEETS